MIESNGKGNSLLFKIMIRRSLSSCGIFSVCNRQNVIDKFQLPPLTPQNLLGSGLYFFQNEILSFVFKINFFINMTVFQITFDMKSRSTFWSSGTNVSSTLQHS
jgi:hypothetical protein